MYSKKLVNFALIICICLIGSSTLIAEVYDGTGTNPITTPILVNDTGLDGSVLTANFLPGAETAIYIQVNSGGDLHLYGGTFNTNFGPIYESFYELTAAGGVITVHGERFWVGDIEINPDINPYIDINPDTTTYASGGDFTFYNIKWEHPNGTIYDIWADSEVPINLSKVPYQDPTPTPNEAPVANAGGPYTANSVDGGPVAVDLTAAASTDADGVITEWNWDLDNDGVYETNAMIVNINSFPVGTSTVGLVVVDNLGIESAPVTTTVTVTQLPPEIDVFPAELTHDYGDIEIGVSVTYVVQIVNSGQGNLNISSIELNGSTDFAITTMPAATIIAPDEIASTDVEITFTPSAEALVQTTLTIASDDADESAVDVVLTGVGVIIEVPVEEQIQDTITFFNQSIVDGIIIGYAPKANSKAADNRVKAMGNMLKAAGKLIEIGETETAIKQLQSIAKKTDGLKSPPDFVIGDGVAEFNQKINDMIAALSL